MKRYEQKLTMTDKGSIIVMITFLLSVFLMIWFWLYMKTTTPQETISDIIRSCSDIQMSLDNVAESCFTWDID